MISKVLQEKRKNLLELNKNSSELFLSKGFINILKFVDKEQLLSFIENKEAFELKIDINSILTSTMSMLQACQTSADLVQKIKSLNIDYDVSKINVEAGKQTQRDNVINSIGKAILAEFAQINKFSKASAEEFYESGKWCFYLCSGILESSIGEMLSTDKINIRAPLLALPVAVKKVSDTCFLLYKREKEFVANEILSIYLKDKLNVSYLKEGELEAGLPIPTLYINIASRIPGCTINNELKLLEEVKKTGYQPQPNPVIHNCLYLAFINPIGGKMLNDYDQIISTDYSFPQENLMFTNQGLDELVYKDDDVMEVSRLLNISQKKAVIASLKTNTLIYGPPGTGKSEVVTSIIANNIAAGFNVLISSEKKAALDVIMDRLDNLKSITMSVNPEDIESFYERIIAINDEIIGANVAEINRAKPEYGQLVKYINEIISINNDEVKKESLANVANKQEVKPIDKEVLDQMLNKLYASKWSVNDFVNRLYDFNKVAKIFSKYYVFNSMMTPLFKKDLAAELLEIVKNTKEEKKRFHILNNFIVEGKAKAGLFCRDINDNERAQLNDLIDAFEKIATGPQLVFFINYSEWKDTINSIEPQALINQLEVGSTKSDKSFNSIFEDMGQGKVLNQYLNQYWAANTAKAALTTKLIKDKYLYDLKKKFMNDPKMQEVWIEMVKKAHLPTKINVAKFIKEYYGVLKFVFPIWILSPDNVANYIPLNQHEFAVGIFDEASQMRVERSIPLIYRCTRNVVSGDDKQLRPSRFFAATVSFDEDDLTSSEELDNVESLLDKAKIANWASFTLSNHYRSNCEELIGFSNKYIYENKLLCITKNGCNHSKPIEVVQMPESTVYDRSTNTNPDEAKKVVDIVKSNEHYKKIVIITFNQKQADLIESLCYQFPILTSRIEADTICIRSIENVQGDEADLVVISTTFGTDAQGKFINNFGPVGQAGGKNRLNVMVTRAKEKMVVVKSFKSEMVNAGNNDNLYILKMFLFYIENLQDNKNIIAEAAVKSVGKPISEVIAQQLKSAQAGLNVSTNYVIGSHNFDLAITNGNDVKLLILVDDKNDLAKANINKWVDSFDQQKYYADRGYNILRFNELEWNFAKQVLINKIVELAR